MKPYRLLCALFVLILSSAVIANDAAQKAVLVTGASSGSGRVIAETLAARGYYVYATARKQADLDALNAIENVHAIRLDVTVQAEIDAAVEMVRKNGKGLYGLVNNAGVATMGPLIEIADSEMEFVFDVIIGKRVKNVNRSSSPEMTSREQPSSHPARLFALRAGRNPAVSCRARPGF